MDQQTLASPEGLQALLEQAETELEAIQPKIVELEDKIKELNTLKQSRQRLLTLKMSLGALIESSTHDDAQEPYTMISSNLAQQKLQAFEDDYTYLSTHKSFHPDLALQQVQQLLKQKESLNYDGKEIQLIFSENITLKNQKEQIIVTPDIGKDYKIEFNKKTVTLKLEKKLKDSTTYTFSFRDAIVDLNEQNPARNLKLAFSTGNYIDSLSIEGKVTDCLTSKELKDMTVAITGNNNRSKAESSSAFNNFSHSANIDQLIF